MTEKKYKLTDDIIVHKGHTLHRIKALRDFETTDWRDHIKKNEFGGYIEKESNLSHDGRCWIFDDAKVYKNAKVYENAIVCDNSTISGNAEIYGNVIVKDNAIIGTWVELKNNEVISGKEERYKCLTRIDYDKKCKLKNYCFPYDLCTWDYVKSLANMSDIELRYEYVDRTQPMKNYLFDWYINDEFEKFDKNLTHIFNLDTKNKKCSLCEREKTCKNNDANFINLNVDAHIRYYLITQEYLTRKFDKKPIRLYRGTNNNRIDISIINNVKYAKLENITSWTDDINVAKSFASSGDNYSVLETLLNKELIFSTYELAYKFDIHGEDEYIVMGNRIPLTNILKLTKDEQETAQKYMEYKRKNRNKY